MILLTIDKEEGIKAATIQKPDVKARIMEVLSSTYKPETAVRYAEAVANFLINEMSFPEDGIYKLCDEKLYRFNLKSKSWDDNGNAKEKYVIHPISTFWINFDEKFPYLANFRSQMMMVVKNATEKMFDITPVCCRFITVEENGFYADKDEGYALEQVFSDYCTDEATAAMTSELLQAVFNTNGYPVFIVIDNTPKIALTESAVFTKTDIDLIDGFLKRRFSPEDTVQISVRVRNSVMFGRDFEFQIDSIASNGDIFYQFAGVQFWNDHNETYYGGWEEPVHDDYLVDTEENKRNLESKPIRSYSGHEYYELCEGRKKKYVRIYSAYVPKKIHWRDESEFKGDEFDA